MKLLFCTLLVLCPIRTAGGQAQTAIPEQPRPPLVVWANDGGDKVTRDELRATQDPPAVLNRLWDGQRIRLFGARNEVVSFNLVLEAPAAQLSSLSVEFNRLATSGYEIASNPHPGQSLFDWRGRPIELFFVRYLRIVGLSRLTWDTYDERHVPERMRRPWSGDGHGSGTWFDRPDHDKLYPDIAVPLELHPTFTIPAGENQSIWADVYIPKDAPSGNYSGMLRVRVGGALERAVPVELEVRDFSLPDDPTCETMAYLGFGDPNLRYLGVAYPGCGTPEDSASREILDRHFQLAHRHRVSLITSEAGCNSWTQDRPRPEWEARLDGSLFTGPNGYDGPGVGVGNGVYSIGTYGSWWWQGGGEAAMRTHTDGWFTWFQNNAPQAEPFLYLIDESDNFSQIETWASWITNNPGPGQDLLSMATLNLTDAVDHTPNLDVPTSTLGVGITADWEQALSAIQSDPEKRFYCYNGSRPAGGTFATEDDGVALRVAGWAQFKKGIDRWFYWESTYYDNFQGGTGQTNVWQQAHTFGGHSGFDNVLGETGWNYTNGDGVLFYPGTDTVFPSESYGLDGPVASLRLKHWRRGVQDYEYLSLAAAVDPVAVQAIVEAMIPEILWEYGVDDPDDPTWVRTDISWSIDPDVWEDAREALADIIDP